MLQGSLFEAPVGPDDGEVLGEQKDIVYLRTASRSVLNSPATTGMGFWSINPYVGCAFGCAYCYARYAHRYVMERRAAQGTERPDAVMSADALPPWLAFERRIFVKQRAAALVRRALGRASIVEGIREGGVVIGTATDPYQPAERRFRLTRGVLEVLAEHRGLSVTIITKSPLVTRDVDLLSRIAERSSVSVHVSLISVDRELARRLEPRAPTPGARLRAIARLRAHGIEVGVNVMPVLPGITDGPDAVEALVRAVADSGASYLGACALRLRRTARDRYLPFIDEAFPHLSRRYRTAYARGYQVSERYRAGLRARFAAVCARHGVVFDQHYRSEHADEADRAEEPGIEQLPRAVEQLSLLPAT
jgi:DNA repair photolyase